MNENYLWDKSGEDAEIEKLENALSVFRYEETAPPALPAKILEFEPRRAKFSPRLIFAFAACLTIFAVSSAIWLNVFKQHTNAEISAAQSEISPIAAPSPSLPKENIVMAKIIENGRKNPEGKYSIPSKIVFKKFADQAAIAVNKPVKIKFVKKIIEPPKITTDLTKDELYAYQQLMTALSITSDKLRLVKDKAESTNRKQ